ncbi:AsmA family protein [Chitinophaga tropicalis]|uniref:AsmA family protein n=1 Tax=Chitinophaga tropicalis TaxID=2683588 RepID=A0A7K1U7F2_9BACT|nr:AsmA family protein [Chitinophaga tropicalis]MVT10282.1 AsmA family protein [Chitinophaga tropicalis]
MLSDTMMRAARKTLKITSISVVAMLLLLFLLPLLFPGAVSRKIKTWANNNITGEIDFSKARLSFFNHFPSLTLTLHDFSLKGSAPFEHDTLIAADEVALGVNLTSIFSGNTRIDKIYLTQGKVHVLVDTEGRPNYNVYKSTGQGNKSSDSTGVSLKIEKIQLEHCRIIYNDKSLALHIRASDVNYVGKGNLSKSQFDLYSHIGITSFDLSYGGVPYIQSKKLDGNLITRINTRSLNFIFEKNDLKINRLPMRLKGEFSFLKNGYKMDFKLSSVESGLDDLLSALPSKYISWLENADIKGTAEVNASLTGKYVAKTNRIPDFDFNIKIKEGVIAGSGAPYKIEGLHLDFQVKLPQMNTDRLTINADSVYFKLDNGYFNSAIRITGLTRPDIHAKMDADIDMEKWSKAMGWKDFDLQGRLQAHLKADGRYIQENGTISSIPVFNFSSALSNGYLKFKGMSEPVRQIGFEMQAYCPDNNYANVHVNVDRINAQALGNYIRGYLRLNNAQEPQIDASLQGQLHMAEVEEFYPLDGIDLDGELNFNVLSKGIYQPARSLFPVTTATLNMDNGTVETKYYKHPIEKINVNAVLTDTAGNFQSLKVDIKPVTFQFEGQTFTLKAALNNFDNLQYNISANGVIDLGRIYKVLGKEGYDVNGYIKTDLSLQGTRNDAMTSQYDKLLNKGSLTLKGVTVKSDLFPLPFHIDNGVFRFEEDKMWFDKFDAHYGKSDLRLDGHLYNLVGYITQKGQQLQGVFDLKSRYILVDELMSYTETDFDDTGTPGVVVIPDNLALTLNAAAEKVRYKGIDIRRFHGQLLMSNGTLQMNRTGFNIIGAPVEMNGQYASLNKQSAVFDYHINAKEFDIKRAYNEIQLFHDMASSAASASGIVGLDYHVNGRLDENMRVVYPSLKGEGVLSLKKIKIKGFKLFNAVSRSTGKHDMKDPDLSEVDIRSAIANNIITIEKTKMRIAGLRPRFEGQVSFDGRLSLKGRIGLPPLGIWGIPFNVTGSQRNPVVKLRRGNSKDSLERSDDAD